MTNTVNNIPHNTLDALAKLDIMNSFDEVVISVSSSMLNEFSKVTLLKLFFFTLVTHNTNLWSLDVNGNKRTFFIEGKEIKTADYVMKDGIFVYDDSVPVGSFSKDGEKRSIHIKNFIVNKNVWDTDIGLINRRFAATVLEILELLR